jgi:hypothetical protein
MIAELRALPSTMGKVLPKAGEAIIEEIGKNIVAQQGPDGQKWKPGIEGHPVLVNAKKALSQSVSGRTLVVTLSGVEARHHLGAIKGGGSITLGPGGKRRDKGHRKGERAKLAAVEGSGIAVGSRMGQYARTILPTEQSKTTLRRAFDKAVAEGLSPAIWRGAK